MLFNKSQILNLTIDFRIHVYLKYEISPNTLQTMKFSSTDVSEVSSKLSHFLTYLTAIDFLLATQKENMDFHSQLKSIG